MIERAAAFKHRRGDHGRSGAVCIDAQDLCCVLFGFQAG
jgi:hypothetical protein